jgi:hypothetical protein
MFFYELNVAVFAAGSAYLLYRQYCRSDHRQRAEDKTWEREMEDQSHHRTATDSSAASRRFQIGYFSVYTLAVAADWLQVFVLKQEPCPFSPQHGD